MSGHRGPLRTTKAFREQRTQRCMEYLRRAGDIPTAVKLAREEGRFATNTSAWLTALGRLLKEKTS